MSGLFLFYFILCTGFHLKLGATGGQIVNRQHRSARAGSKIESAGLPGRSPERSGERKMVVGDGFEPCEGIVSRFTVCFFLGGKSFISQGVLTCSTFPSASRTLKTTSVAFVDETKTLPSAFVVTDETPQTPG